MCGDVMINGSAVVWQSESALTVDPLLSGDRGVIVR
jgi:hypothetical protein